MSQSVHSKHLLGKAAKEFLNFHSCSTALLNNMER